MSLVEDDSISFTLSLFPLLNFDPKRERRASRLNGPVPIWLMHRAAPVMETFLKNMIICRAGSVDNP
jgi:hypothetical protein